MRFTPLLATLALLLATGVFAQDAPAPTAAAETATESVEAAAEVVEEAAEEAPEAPAGPVTADEFYADFTLSTQAAVNHGWTILCASLVFFMQAGFCAVTAAFCRQKNTVNIVMKSTLDFCLGSLFYLAIGFGLQFGATNGYFGTNCFFLSGVEDLWANVEAGKLAADSSALLHGRLWPYTFWMFQAAFAGAAATIVAGAAGERVKFSAYLVYSSVIVALIYPIQGSWYWGSLFLGSGWLENVTIGGISYAVYDFAGSTVVHSCGGWAALAAAITLGPRIGKYGPTGTVRVIPGHNILMGSIGVFILFFGWFGFNPGSTLAANDQVGRIAVVTALGGCGGCVSALFFSWIITGKPDVGLTLNGLLGGLVAVTAGCAAISPASSVLIGAIAGVIVIGAVFLLDKVHIDDPVGAVPVHLCCGMWGTLSTGIFMFPELVGKGAEGATRVNQILVQLLGIGVNAAWTFGTMMIVFLALKAAGQLRVSKEEELEGLDYGEHGASAYPEFTITVLK